MKERNEALSSRVGGLYRRGKRDTREKKEGGSVKKPTAHMRFIYGRRIR